MTTLTHHGRVNDLIGASATWAAPHLIISEVGPDGSRSTRVVHLSTSDDTWVIGRGDEADIHLEDPHISRRHAMISIQQGRITIEDLHARWGITKSGEKVVGRCVMQHGDHVVMGSTTITLNHYWEQLQRQRATPVSTSAELRTRGGVGSGTQVYETSSSSPISVGPSILGWTLPKYSRPLEAPPPPLAPPAKWEENVKLVALLVLALGGIYLIISLFFPGAEGG